MQTMDKFSGQVAGVQTMTSQHGGRFWTPPRNLGTPMAATTMGFTALDGLVMSGRCGSLDLGVVLYLMGEKGMTAAAISDLLYQSSGLLGVSGFSDDMKTLLATDKAHAAEAVDLFVYRICCELGSLAAAWVGLMPSFSPRASASTLLKFAVESAGKRAGSGWKSTRR